MASIRQPHIVVLSSLFPSSVQPGAGLFIRERMFRVGQRLPLSVVSPSPCFPLQSLIRRFRPGFRPGAPREEIQSGFQVHFPHFLSIPGLLKQWDGLMMALGSLLLLRRLKAQGKLDIIDAHFAYPDGYAALLLGRWLGVPYTVTLRGTETRHLQTPGLAERALKAIHSAARVFSVSESLKKLAVKHGADPARIEVVGNGVDIERFKPVDRQTARAAMRIELHAKVLISVGGLVPRKGFHRVIEVLPGLRIAHPDLKFLIVGGPSPEGNNRAQLERQVNELELKDCVIFLGPVKPDQLPALLSAADVFVLATSNEGWANVFLEAMACGLPVVTTDVGGNREVINDDSLGFITPLGDPEALADAIRRALAAPWDRQHIRSHAENNAWDERIERLCARFASIAVAREKQG
jgi:teichuronic acid biosynthesis glycosyltransferase TuaC